MNQNASQPEGKLDLKSHVHEDKASGTNQEKPILMNIYEAWTSLGVDMSLRLTPVRHVSNNVHKCPTP